MLIKEYRIPLPLTLEEYKIAQLYMIQKKSRIESTGAGSGVEILENSPYQNGPGGSGQYTKKIYHVGNHLPGWLKSLLPKTALQVEEEAWNAYPYTKTRHTCPFVEKFSIDIETRYLADYGQTENVFNLSGSQRKEVEIDFVDPVSDVFPEKDYKKEEDPLFYVSKKTQRGPLNENWLADYKNGNSKSPVMCAYKLISVEFKYWGMQSKIEHFIHGGLRNPILVGHRQAWVWQDEWYGMTIEDIRLLEKQTQSELLKVMSDFSEHNDKLKIEPSIVAKAEDKPIANFNIALKESLEGKKTEMCTTNVKSDFDSDNESNDNSDEEDLIFYDALESLGENLLVNKQKSSNLNKFHSISLDPIIIKKHKVKPQVNTSLKSSNNHTLLFVLHGGGISEHEPENIHKWREFETLEKNLTNFCDKYYPELRSKLHIKLIECPLLANPIINSLRNLYLAPTSNPSVLKRNDSLPNSFPFCAVPGFILDSPAFQPALNDIVDKINKKYTKVVKELGQESLVEVHMVGDCIGGLLLFYSLQATTLNRYSVSLSGMEDSSSFKGSSVFTDKEIAPESKLSNSSAEDFEEYKSDVLHYDFVVKNVFAFGSPIGITVYKDKLVAKGFHPPRCDQFYNIFHPFDPMSSRIEPLIDKKFSKINPSIIPRHQSFPYTTNIESDWEISADDSTSFGSKLSICSNGFNEQINCLDGNINDFWWGDKRIDYILHCPAGVDKFPFNSLHQLCYNNYWESKDIVAFILWQIFDFEQYIPPPVVSDIGGSFFHQHPQEKWMKKKTKVKIKNMSPNHRANDIVVLCGSQTFIIGKFTYGPLDIATLNGEKVDIYITKSAQFNDWSFVANEVTDKHGKVLHPFQTDQPGVHSIRMVVRGDHSFVDCSLAILPPSTEAVVFSIDSSFLSSYSIFAKNPKVRGGAVDVVRHWQELGYLIIYVSSRLLFQKCQVTNWLSEHKFPFGIVSFGEHVTGDYQKHKIDFLKRLMNVENVLFHAVYGSSRDSTVYLDALKISPSHVFLVSKKNKGNGVQWIVNGYSSHLADLKQSSLSIRSKNNHNLFFSLGSFGTNHRISSKEHSAEKKYSVNNDNRNTTHSLKRNTCLKDTHELHSVNSFS
ncbi:membrane-associated phosphatidylinositol transfer protein 2 isoform X2 [Hydra vulgaris]|uniref:Membrane-associated phosphatidylinositol transfer protein 2 isoform X2 n=1 Tax=Hydra vulgaris TaxID=6087 RepID=A0ABM4CNN4_HYDVU